MGDVSRQLRAQTGIASAQRHPITAALARLPPLLAALLFAFGAYVAFRFPVHHDTSWFQYLAERWIDGAQLYVDVIDVNPPLVALLHAIPELLSRVVPLWNVSAFKLFVLALAAGSLVACRIVLRRIYADSPLTFQLLTVLLAYLFVALPRYEFGLREHITLLATAPWLLTIAATPQHAPGPKARFGMGVAAGLGFAMKPYFLPAWALLALLVAVRSGVTALRRAEHVGLVVTGALYGLFVLLITPEYLPVARFTRDTYSAYGTVSPWPLLTLPQARLVGGALACSALALGLGRWRAAFTDVGRLLPFVATATFGFAGAVLLQRRGWDYHWLPARTCAWLLFGVVLVTLAAPVARRLPLRRSQLAHAATIGLTALPLFWLTSRGLITARVEWQGLRGRSYQLPALAALVEHTGPEPTIAAFSTNMQASFPLVSYTGAKWVLRFNTLWPLVGMYAPRPNPAPPFPYHPPALMNRDERFFFDGVIADLVSHRPDLLIVDTTPPGYVLRGFDYLQYFGQDPRFRTMLAEYRELTPIQRYRVFRRADSAQPGQPDVLLDPDARMTAPRRPGNLPQAGRLQGPAVAFRHTLCYVRPLAPPPVATLSSGTIIPRAVATP